MQQLYHYTDETAYEAIIGSADTSGFLRPSGIFGPGTGDIDYGTGWYITTLPPTTSTDGLLRHLWRSNPEKRARTGFWLELTVSEPELYVTFPDPDRPMVALVRYYRRNPSVDGPAVSITGQTPALLLAAGGRRIESADGQVEVITLYRPSEERVVSNPSVVALTGIRSFDWFGRLRLREQYKIEDPDDAFHIQPERLIDESNALFQRGELANALFAIEAAISLDSRISTAWSNKGAILAALGRREDAIAAYRQALEIDPRDTDALRNMAASLLKLKRYQDAFEMCERGLAVEPEDAGLWTNMGTIQSARGHEDEALKAYDKALQIDPAVAQAWNNRAGIIAQRAVAAVQQRSQSPHAAAELISAAIESYVHAIESNSDYENAREGLRMITKIALDELPRTWACEDAVWRAAAMDSECAKEFTLHLLAKPAVECHPRYGAVIQSKGYNPTDGEAMASMIREALVVVGEQAWDAEDWLSPGRERIQIGVCLLADLLSRRGLPKLALQLGEIAANAESGASLEVGTLLQIAKSLAYAGKSLRAGAAYDNAIETYQQARKIYERCGDKKYAANMTFNVGAAYAWRSGPGDQDRAKAAFDASFEEFDRAGLGEERRAAEKEAQQLLKLYKGVGSFWKRFF